MMQTYAVLRPSSHRSAGRVTLNLGMGAERPIKACSDDGIGDLSPSTDISVSSFPTGVGRTGFAPVTGP
ncbi:MAG: hypothetical protein AAGA26_11435, partial [Pseudomonadota bacterium]